jgi:GDP-4-dehydro-6-deoxy-D-mannose reductase
MKDCILITGIHGFCARHLAKRLVAEGLEQIYGADIHPGPPDDLPLQGYFRLDIRIPANVHSVIHSVMPDLLFHLAGISRGEASEIYQVNFLGGVYLLDAVRSYVPQARVLLVGSAAEYGHVDEGDLPIRETHSCNPSSPYGISKHALTLAAVNYANDHGVKAVIARPFNIVGAGVPPSLVVGAVLSRIRDALRAGKEPAVVRVGNLETERDFIAVEDVADAYLMMIRCDCWGNVFNICSGEPNSVRTILRSLAAFSKRRIEFREDAALVRSTDVRRVYGSAEKARRLLGFSLKVSLAVALKAAWDDAMAGAD